MKSTRFLSLAATLLALLSTVTTVFAASTTVLVSGNTSTAENSPGWMFNRDVSTSTPFGFTTAQASIGLGSLYVSPIGANAADKFVAENFLNVPISDLDSVSYDFRIGPNTVSTKEEHFYMSVYANFGSSDPLKFYDCRYSVIPTVGSNSGFTTVTFDPSQAYSVTTRGTSPFPCPAVPADMNTLSSGSRVRMFSLNAGDTSSSDQGLDGYFDNVVVTRNGESTIFDFEPVLSPTSKEDCKKNGWMNFNTPSFKNQGSCVSFMQSHSKNR